MRRYVDGPYGQVHLHEMGEGPTVVLLHQVPRSADEYAAVLPLLAARGLRAVAVDLPGYGLSDPGPADTIEAYAHGIRGVVDGADALVGHHTGGVVAVELAATLPIARLVLSSTPYVDAAHRARPAHGVDHVTPDDDGTHLGALWRGRQGFYPAGRRELLEHFVRDALSAGLDRSAAGHAAVRAYEMETRLPLVIARTLIVAASDDPYARPDALSAALPAAPVVTIDGGTVPLPDHLPAEFAAVIADFVSAGR